MRTKRLILFLSLSVFLLIFGVFIYRTISTSPIELPKEINLGDIRLTDKPVFTVTVKNISNSIVDIPRVYTSCGCTTVLAPSGNFTLNPGSSMGIKIQFDPSSMHKVGDNVYHEIYVLTSKPTEKEYMVKMKGNIL